MAPRKIAFVLAATGHGTMILNRLDAQIAANGGLFGVGGEILELGGFEQATSAKLAQIIEARRQAVGDGVVVLDCGANIGAMTVEWAKFMHGWGQVIAIEAQERLFYALAGNIAINNCFNARAMNVALGAVEGTMQSWLPDYTVPANFGGVGLLNNNTLADIGQEPGGNQGAVVEIKSITLDSLGLSRVDFIKIDVEGMEMHVLRGAADCLRKRPIMWVEHAKVGWDPLASHLGELGYQCHRFGKDMLAIHSDDPVHQVFAIDAG